MQEAYENYVMNVNGDNQWMKPITLEFPPIEGEVGEIKTFESFRLFEYAEFVDRCNTNAEFGAKWGTVPAKVDPLA